MDELELRVAWERHVAGSGGGRAWFDSLLARHREPHRRYHGVRHVRWVVRRAQELGALHAARVQDLGAVVAAAFFHDAVYDPARVDNETVSAGMAGDALVELGWARERAAAVAELVRATAGHAHVTGPAAPLDTAVLLAADLAVLAADPAGYRDYVVAVRSEYAEVSDAAWCVGRSRVLRSFVDRPAIYEPQLRLPDWERRARGNIAAELASLEQGSVSDA